MVAGVAGPVARILAEVQADEILEGAFKNPGGRLRVQLHEDAVNFTVDGRRVGGIDPVRHVVVVSAFHFLARLLNLRAVLRPMLPLTHSSNIRLTRAASLTAALRGCTWITFGPAETAPPNSADPLRAGRVLLARVLHTVLQQRFVRLRPRREKSRP